MIKNCDLTQKLAYGKTKRIADIYGLSVFLRGGKYGTTHIYQQRVTVKGISHFLTIKADTLKEARRIAMEQYFNLTGILIMTKLKLRSMTLILHTESISLVLTLNQVH